MDARRHRRQAIARRFMVGILSYAFRIGFLLLAQLVYIPVAFLVFPVGALSIFTTVAHLLFVALGNPAATSQLPLTCVALKLGPDKCASVLPVIHLVQILLAYLTLRYADWYFVVSKEYYEKGIELLQRLLDSPDWEDKKCSTENR